MNSGNPDRRAGVVFGTCPGNRVDWRREEKERAEAAVGLMAQGMNFVVCVGGERFVDGGVAMTEALSVQRKIVVVANERGVDLSDATFVREEEGLETVKQVAKTIGILREADLVSEPVDVVTSWHQLARLTMMFREMGGVEITPRVANPIQFSSEFPHDVWNLMTGLGYVALMFQMQKMGYWQDGGPAITYYTNKRNGRRLVAE